MNRQLFQEVFRIDKDKDYASYVSAPTTQVEDWNGGGDTGPNEDYLQFDMRGPHDSPWNTTIITTLTKLLGDKVTEVGYVSERPEDYYRALVVDKFKRCQRVWKNARPKLNERGVMETPEQLEKRMEDESGERSRVSRQAERRRNVRPQFPHWKFNDRLQRWKRRLRIVNNKVRFEARGDLAVWEWLQKLVYSLGVDGMSSDESEDGDDTEILYRVKRMPWRRDIRKELEIIDTTRVKEKGIFSRQGSRPVKRIRGDEPPVSAREAPRFLPKELYDGGWLQEQRFPDLKPGFSQEQFDWMEIVG